jgi:hypothetical protein
MQQLKYPVRDLQALGESLNAPRRACGPNSAGSGDVLVILKSDAPTFRTDAAGDAAASVRLPDVFQLEEVTADPPRADAVLRDLDPVVPGNRGTLEQQGSRRPWLRTDHLACRRSRSDAKPRCLFSQGSNVCRTRTKISVIAVYSRSLGLFMTPSGNRAAGRSIRNANVRRRNCLRLPEVPQPPSSSCTSWAAK